MASETEQENIDIESLKNSHRSIAILLHTGQEVQIVKFQSYEHNDNMLLTEANNRHRSRGFANYLPNTMEKFIAYWELLNTDKIDFESLVEVNDGIHDRVVPLAVLRK
jgi:hypothetical protein